MINNDILDRLVNTNNLNYDSLKVNLDRICDSINSLVNSYSGDCLNYISNNADNQIYNINKIIKVVKAYSDVLNNVKISYNMQDVNISNIVNSTNSQIN